MPSEVVYKHIGEMPLVDRFLNSIWMIGRHLKNLRLDEEVDSLKSFVER